MKRKAEGPTHYSVRGVKPELLRALATKVKELNTNKSQFTISLWEQAVWGEKVIGQGLRGEVRALLEAVDELIRWSDTAISVITDVVAGFNRPPPRK